MAINKGEALVEARSSERGVGQWGVGQGWK